MSIADYWLAEDSTNLSNVFDLLKLQRAVANFVKIVSGRDIPVEFQYHNDKSTIDKIIISADLSNIDATVGLAIHETLSFIHSQRWCVSQIITLLNDTYLTNRYATQYTSLSSSERFKYKNTLRSEIEGVYYMLEYWRIDDLAIQSSPGYKGYILAAYRELFQPAMVVELLNRQRNQYDRRVYFYLFFAQITESLYYRDSVPDLDEKRLGSKAVLYYKLSDLIRINRLDRLQSSEETLALAISVWEAIDEYASKVLPDRLNPEEGSEPMGPDDKPAEVEPSDSESFAKQLFASAALNIQKKSIPVSRKEDLQTLFSDSLPSEYYTEYDNRRIKVVVLKEMNRDLVYSMNYPFFETGDVHAMENVVAEGIQLGKNLARKIAFRNDNRQIRFSRLERGKIDRRLLHSVAYGNEVIFFQNKEETFPSVHFHISIDGSHSMSGNCFRQSIKTAVAIAQAAEMTRNVRVTISLRYHTVVKSMTLPLVLIAYDSRKDKLYKIRQLFRFLKATGPTPEGLCYPVITDLIDRLSDDNTENYFINLYDGMPAFIIDDDCVYEGAAAIEHTRNEVLRMRRKHIKIRSYFIVSEKWKARNIKDTFEKFRYMYGKDAEMINLDALGELAKSLNKLVT